MNGAGNTNALRLGVTGQSGFRFDNVSVHARTFDAAKSTTYAYNTSNQLTSSVTNGTTTNYTYDAWGRLATRAQGSYAASYAYRYGGRLYSQTSNFPGEGNVTLQYRGDGRLYGRTDASTSVRYRYDAGWNPLVETDASGNVLRTNMFMPGSSRAPMLMTSFGTLGAGTPMYAYRDHLDSVRRWRWTNKNSAQANEFDPYGKLYAGTTYAYPQVFALHPYDPAMAAYRAPYRNYSPTMARWMTRDPLGMVDGPNVYGYVRGRPATLHDKHGLQGYGGLSDGGFLGDAMAPADWVTDMILDKVKESITNPCITLCDMAGLGSGRGNMDREIEMAKKALELLWCVAKDLGPEIPPILESPPCKACKLTKHPAPCAACVGLITVRAGASVAQCLGCL